MDAKEAAFHQKADAWLEWAFERIEAQDAAGALEIDLEGGALAISAPGGERFLVSKHAASGEMWYSSPFSGGLHFQPAEKEADWKLKDGRRLSVVLAEELFQATGSFFKLEP